MFSAETLRLTAPWEIARDKMYAIHGYTTMVDFAKYLKKQPGTRNVELYESTAGDPECRLRIMWDQTKNHAKQLELAAFPNGDVKLTYSLSRFGMVGGYLTREGMKAERIRMSILAASHCISPVHKPVMSFNNGFFDKIRGKQSFVFWKKIPLR